MYKIKSCGAGTTATDTDLTLYDPITFSLATASEATVLYNPYYAVVQCTAATDDVVGVPPIAVPASNYFWLQTWGICPVYQIGTPVVGTTAFLGYDASATAAGVTGVADTVGWTAQTAGVSLKAAIIGRLYAAVRANTEYTAVYLMIAP
jgi:hypothetical protein